MPSPPGSPQSRSSRRGSPQEKKDTERRAERLTASGSLSGASPKGSPALSPKGSLGARKTTEELFAAAFAPTDPKLNASEEVGPRLAVLVDGLADWQSEEEAEEEGLSEREDVSYSSCERS